MGSKAPLSINPEQTLGFRPGKVEGLIFPSISDNSPNDYIILIPSVYPVK
jgi:hypothetical protein